MGIEKGIGIVLRARKSAESDLVVTWFSEGWGKRTAVAKRARRFESDLGAIFEPLNGVEVVFYARSRVDLVSQATLLEGRRGVRGSLPRLHAGLAVSHLLDRLLASHQTEAEVYALWASFLSLLEESQAPAGPLGLAAAVKLLALLGHRPDLSRCAACGRDAEGYSLALEKGGLLCPSCQPPEGMAVTRGLARALDMLLRLPLRRAGVLSLTDEEVAAAWENLRRAIAQLAA